MHEDVPHREPSARQRLIETQADVGFFGRAALQEEELLNRHPVGPEADAQDLIEQRRGKASRLFERLRSSPLARPLFLLMTFLIGAGVYTREKMGESDPEVAAALEDPGVREELKRLMFEELIASGKVRPEQDGRLGREDWTQEEGIEYIDIPDLSGKFEYLHKNDPDIVASYRDPRGRVENFHALFNLMGAEFRHSRLPFDFVEQTIDDALAIFPTLPPVAALEIYHAYEPELMKAGGLKAVRRLSTGFLNALPTGHPILSEIAEKQWLAPEAAKWFTQQEDNFAIFDQLRGRIEIYHRVKGQAVLLDAFAGNGGPPDGVSWRPGMPAHEAVRTPDGDFTFNRSFEKKSVSWPFSWVADTAPLRWTSDGKNIDYKDQDGTWRRLTGDDAEFVVHGAPEKPFKLDLQSRLYKAASEQQDDGTWLRPRPFTVEDVLDEQGNLRPTWDRSDFGPKAIQITDNHGQVMPIYFHSSPLDEDPEKFLFYSHGCVHMKPDNLEQMASYLDRGSRIRISAFEEESEVAQKEKPGSHSGSRGG